MLALYVSRFGYPSFGPSWGVNAKYFVYIVVAGFTYFGLRAAFRILVQFLAYRKNSPNLETASGRLDATESFLKRNFLWWRGFVKIMAEEFLILGSTIIIWLLVWFKYF